MLEREWVMEYTPADHGAVDTGLIDNLKRVLPIAYITIDRQQSIRRYLIAQFLDRRNEFVVCRHFAHLFFGTQVNRQVFDILLQDMFEPGCPFIDFRVAKTGLHAHR